MSIFDPEKKPIIIFSSVLTPPVLSIGSNEIIIKREFLFYLLSWLKGGDKSLGDMSPEKVEFFGCPP